jgi:hypothetical protein
LGGVVPAVRGGSGGAMGARDTEAAGIVIGCGVKGGCEGATAGRGVETDGVAAGAGALGAGTGGA